MKNIIKEACVEKLTHINGIPTSGGAPTAMEGRDQLKQFIRVTQPDFEIIVAGSVTRQNLREIHHAIRAEAYHGRIIA